MSSMATAMPSSLSSDKIQGTARSIYEQGTDTFTARDGRVMHRLQQKWRRP